MRIIYRAAANGIASVGPLEFSGIAATSDLQPDGIALVMSGANLSRFKNGGPLLLQHDPKALVGRVTSIRTTANTLTFTGTFASPGISADADRWRGLVKDGVATGISLGFAVDEAEPINPQRRGDGVRATKWTAYEISICAVQLDPGAVVTARARDRNDLAARQATLAKLAAVGRSHDLAILTEGVPLSLTERQAIARRLSPRGRADTLRELTPRPPTFDGDQVRYNSEMADFLQSTRR